MSLKYYIIKLDVGPLPTISLEKHLDKHACIYALYVVLGILPKEMEL